MYGFSVTVKGALEDVIASTTEALKKEGFGILTEIQADKVMKEKLNADIRPYRILGACNPPLAHEAIEAEPDIGLLLPCNVLVREEASGDITVAFIDPIKMFEVIDREDMRPMAEDVKGRLERVRDNVASAY